MDQQRLDAIRARCEAAQGLWESINHICFFAEYARTDLPDMLAEIERLTAALKLLESDRDAERKIRLDAEAEADAYRRRAEAAETDITALARRAIDGFQDAKFITPCRWCAEREQCDLLTTGMNTCFKWRGPEEDKHGTA